MAVVKEKGKVSVESPKDKDDKKVDKKPVRTPYQRFSTGRPMPVRNVRSA